MNEKSKTGAGKVSDLELVEAYKNGDTEAFDELMNRHAAKLYHTAYGLLSNQQDAEEVVQDAFLRAYRALHKFRGDSSFETWIHRIVINLSRNKYHWNRRRGAEVNISLNQQSRKLSDDNEEVTMTIPDESYEPDRLLQGKEVASGIMSGFEKLPETLKEAMVLRHVNDLPYEKIAELLNCKVGTVKSRIARGREILRGILSKIEIDKPLNAT